MNLLIALEALASKDHDQQQDVYTILKQRRDWLTHQRKAGATDAQHDAWERERTIINRILVATASL